LTNIEHGELAQDGAELLIECILAEFDLPHVEVANATDFEVFVDDLQKI